MDRDPQCSLSKDNDGWYFTEIKTLDRALEHLRLAFKDILNKQYDSRTMCSKFLQQDFVLIHDALLTREEALQTQEEGTDNVH